MCGQIKKSINVGAFYQPSIEIALRKCKTVCYVKNDYGV